MAGLISQICVLLLLVSCIHGYNILLLQANVPSHLAMYKPLIKSLASKGHQVTLVVSNETKVPPYDQSGIRVVKFHNLQESILYKNDNELMKRLIKIESIYHMLRLIFLDDILYQYMEEQTDMFRDEEFLKQMDKEKFDLAFVDVDAMSQSILPYRLGIPFVQYGYFCEGVIHRIPEPSSYVPKEYWPIAQNDRLTFGQRMANLLVSGMEEIFHELTENNNYEHVKLAAPNRPLISTLQVIRQAKLCFKLKSEVIDYAKPSMPHVVKIAGFAIEEAKPITDKRILKILNEAKNGVIVASLGTLISKDLPPDNLEALMQGFGKLKVPVIFKYSAKYDKLPGNVHLFDWLPQLDLTAHPKVKAVLIHGGAASTLEAIYHAKPMVIYPFFIDQRLHAGQVEDRGYGFGLNRFTATADDVASALNKVLSDQSFKDTITRASNLLQWQKRDSETSLHQWLDYVMESGAEHVTGRALELSPVVYYNLDVIAVILIAAHVILFVIFAVLRWTYRALFSSGKKRKQE